MKYILLLRHAKSSRKNSGLKDIDQPLANWGQKDASAMGKFLKQVEYIPGTIISSSAVRARQTIELFTDSAGLDKKTIKWDDDFYYGSSVDYLKSIQQCDESARIVLLVGHNPKLEETASLLCGKKRGIIQIPTAALVCMEHPAIEWTQIKEETARLKWMMVPELVNKFSH